jgi:putative ABC transport system permease protein
MALFLAVVGMYGVISYSVSRQTGEIGLRIACGALPRQVFVAVLLQGLAPVLVGLGAGLPAAVAAARALRSLLFGVAAFDPASLIAVAVVVIATAAVSCYVPARRASRLDPMTALRYD